MNTNGAGSEFLGYWLADSFYIYPPDRILTVQRRVADRSARPMVRKNNNPTYNVCTKVRSVFTAAESAWLIKLGETWKRAPDERHDDWGAHEVNIVIPDQLPNPTTGAPGPTPRPAPHDAPPAQPFISAPFRLSKVEAVRLSLSCNGTLLLLHH